MTRGAMLGRLAREWEELTARPGAGPAASRPPRASFPTHPLGLFAELEEVLDLWRHLKPSRLRRHARRYVNAAWRVQDLVAHLASWAAEFRREVETLVEGREIDYAIPFALSLLGPTAWNAAEVERRRTRSLREVIAEFTEETIRLQDLVLRLDAETLRQPALLPAAPSGDPAARLRGSIAMIVSGKCAHDRYHLTRLRERLRGWDAAARP